MALAQLKQVVLAVEENGSAWSSWQSALDIADVYRIELDDDDHALIERAIKTDGRSLPADLRRVEREEWGLNFGGSGVSESRNRSSLDEYWIDRIERKYAA